MKNSIGQTVALSEKRTAKICEPTTANDLASTFSVIRYHFLPLDIDLEAVKEHFNSTRIPSAEIVTISRETHKADHLKHAASGFIRVKIKHSLASKEAINDLNGFAKVAHLKALITVVGTAVRCMKCLLYGHIQRECKAAACAKCSSYNHQTDSCTMANALSGRERERAEFNEISDDIESIERQQSRKNSKAHNTAAKRQQMISNDHKATTYR